MKLLAFTGGMGVGKSTAIESLEFIQRHPIQLVKFAKPLYDIQEYIYRRINTVYDRPESFTKDRKLLQWIGTEWGRQSISDTLWVDLWKAEVTKLMNKGILVVCDDARYDNEAKAVRDLGGYVVKITSAKSEQRIDTKSGIHNHASEIGIDLNLLDCIIENDGSVDELRQALCTMNSKLAIW